MKNILKNYRRRLLNLSSGNKALLLLRLQKELHLDVESLDFIVGQPAFSIVEKLISGAKKIVLSPVTDSRYEPVAAISKRLRYIKRRSDMLLEERGSEELYIGWPFVHGMFADGTVVRCPLFLYPVALQVNAAQEWDVVQSTSQPPRFNQSFLLAYAHYNGAPLPENLLELDVSTLPTHALEFRTQVYELLKSEQLAIHAGRDFFADKLKSFRDYKKADYETDLKPGQLYLEQEAVLGIYPQAASYLLADYDALLEREDLQTMEDLFVTPEILTQATQAQHTFTVFKMDASQEAALQQVKQGKSIVVQGPPGTGKSQLICNLVSDFTARGKKVLVVSQKRAALDVVHKRLSEEGLGAFAALVHDINADRKNIFQQLQLQIDQLPEYKKQNLALNSIYTDRTFLEVSRGINRCIEKLEQFKSALFDTSVCGWSAKELYLRSNLQAPHISLSSNYKFFNATIVAEFLPRLRQFLQQAIVYDRQDFTWKNRHSFKNYGWPHRQELEQTINQLPQQFEAIQQSISNLSGFGFELDELEKYKQALPTITEIQTLLAEENVAGVLQHLLKSNVQELTQQVQQLKELYLVCPAPDAALAATEILTIKQAIARFEEQQNNLLRTIGWVFSSDKKVLKQALANYKLELNESGVGELQRRISLREQAENLMQAINQTIVANLKIEANPNQVLQQITIIEKALQAQKLLKKLHREKVLHEKLLPTIDLAQHLQSITQTIAELQANHSHWLKWITEIQVKQLLADSNYKAASLRDLQEHFEQLVAHDALVSSFTDAEREVAQQLLSQTIACATEGEQFFLNSLYLAWLQEIENQHPELRMASSGELENLELELQHLLNEKQRLSQEIVLSKLREQTYDDMEFNRLGNAVTYRRLQAQVSKKRSLYPIRKLFSLFSDEILNLVPCWLASPETVSAVLPLERCFDVVIFDEASQCFAETGIPAMLRGAQVVVAGDEQQLRPSDLYRARWSDAADEEVEELSAESLLQLCGLYLPQTMLTQHYRSHFPELIEFSNQYFYRSKLELIPDLQELNASKPAIEYLQVKGLWEQNSNLPEAEKVVELVLDLLQKGQQDVGVITFNYNQQMLVQDLLEERAQEQTIVLPPTVLVKNIENMQGDEKDVIILSVGYAPDEKGRFAMQFGSLNQAGGENRLNVAVTRAKRKIIVVASIIPEQLHVEYTQHHGPKLLKQYLHYARQVSQGNFTYQPNLQPMPTQIPLLKEKLAGAIPELQPRVSFADLTLSTNHNYKAAVLTDDDLYYSHVSVRHSHADVPQLLQQRHWPYKKVYSRQFWAEQGKVIAGLQQFSSDAS
ncbi:AAA family ATPase [Microvirga sp. STS03]|uniref:AAA family ATPase n=1 Tax=Pontibacter populi TaxID=890055 RepID=A0ABS6X7J9_9BACT|nr:MULTISPECIES: AAA domain-containing protein [Pontibacter]MBR0569524.1 AAA family ATPase [Microvirga sp. STS03]MBW3363953.1 AAA family ATPase [Pontibacter populi]